MSAVSPATDKDASPRPLRMASADRRTQLLRVGTQLFARKGFNGTTVKEIADAAGVNQTILFRHFATKDELYSAILERKAEEAGSAELLQELRLAAERRDDEGVFRTLAAHILRQIDADPDFLRLMLYSALEGHESARRFRHTQIHAIFKFLCSFVELRQREGAFRKCEPALVARALFGLPSYHAQIVTVFGDRLLPLREKEAAAEFARLVLAGVRVEARGKKVTRRGTNRRTKS